MIAEGVRAAGAYWMARHLEPRSPPMTATKSLCGACLRPAPINDCRDAVTAAFLAPFWER